MFHPLIKDTPWPATPGTRMALGPLPGAASTAAIRLVGYTGKLRLRMTLNGAARLYAFRVKAG